MSLPLVEIKNLTLKYGNYTALKDINTSFFPGKCCNMWAKGLVKVLF